jgi:hypothetical protein
LPKGPSIGSTHSQIGAAGNVERVKKDRIERIKEIKKEKIDTTAINILDGKTILEVNKLLNEQSNLIKNTRLKSFAIKHKNVLELTKEGNAWIEARLKNMNNILKYCVKTKDDMSIREPIRLSVNKIKNQLLKDIIDIGNQIAHISFKINRDNRRILHQLKKKLNK